MRDAVTGAARAQAAGIERRIRGGRGFGDALYVRPIADYFIAAGDRVTVMTDYRDVFRGTRATVEPFNKDRVNVVAHYVSGKANRLTTQWQDVCISARVSVELRFTWNYRPTPLTNAVLREARGKPIILVNGGRYPMDRRDGFGLALLPRREAFEHIIGAFGDAFTVRIGRGPELYPIGCDMDLTGATSVGDVLDLAHLCVGVLGQCSFAIPLAEAFDKPMLLLWAATQSASPQPFVRMMTPRKLLSKPTSRHVMDDAPQAELEEAARAFRRLG